MKTPKLTACSFCLLLALAVQSQQRLPRRDTLAGIDTLQTEIKEQLLDNIPVISLDENELNNNGSSAIASLLTAGRDPFYSAAAFNFSAARFRMRGYENDAFALYLNGAPMENLDNGSIPYSNWSGLNTVLRNRDMAVGLRANAYAFGALGTTTAIDARASQQQKQTNIRLGMANRNYTCNLAASYASGLNRKGWAYLLAGSLRWANEGYIPGSFYHGGSYLLAADKKLSAAHLLSFTILGSLVENGRAGASVAEMQQLAHDVYYNPYWGYQNGKKRNAAVAHLHQPTAIVTHAFTISEHTSLTTALAYTGGNNSTTGLEWYNAPDPRPDYYRYLPSYVTDAEQKQAVTAQMEANENLRQINWPQLYAVNRADSETVYNADGIAGNNLAGHRSRYIVEEQVRHVQRLAFNSTLHAQVNEQVELDAGLSYQQQTTHYYKRLNDLLGGDFYVDLNQYAERDFPNNNDAIQNDLKHPNRVVHTGDRLGYDYAITVNKTSGWLQALIKQAHYDFFVATAFSRTAFWRTGYVTNGLFPYNSFGKSDVYAFSNYAVKGGITYKINGRHYVYVNGAYLTRAPFYNNVFISPSTRDNTQASLTAETIRSAEAGYVFNAPRLKLRLSGYYTQSAHGLDVLSFYHDDYRNFVNDALSNIGKLYYGGELGVDAKILPNVNMNIAVAAGRYLYNSRQHATITLDNSTALLGNETVYLQNFRIGGTPQQAVSVGFTYRSPAYWFISITGNYMDEQWLSLNPIRRTFAATEGLPYKNTQWHEVVDQQKLQGQYLLDCFAGYSWRLPWQWGFKKPVYLVFNAGISNLLNNRQLVSGGYEQLRFDFDNKDIRKFPPKLYYAYGLNYVLNATLRF